MIEDVAALVLNDPDIGAVDIVAAADDGTLYHCRALFTHLPESVDQLKSAFSRSGLNAWVAASDLPAYADISHIVTVGGVTHRVLDRERVAGSVRFQLLSVEGAPPAAADFRVQDFGADFNVG